MRAEEHHGDTEMLLICRSFLPMKNSIKSSNLNFKNGPRGGFEGLRRSNHAWKRRDKQNEDAGDVGFVA
jgi:hypothetical protein